MLGMALHGFPPARVLPLPPEVVHEQNLIFQRDTKAAEHAHSAHQVLCPAEVWCTPKLAPNPDAGAGGQAGIR